MASLISGALLRGLAVWTVAVCWLGCGVVRAQSDEAGIKARLAHKELYLRGFWLDNKLKFSPEGNLLTPSPITSFTLSGVDFDWVSLKKGKLTIGGTRKCLQMKKGQMERVSCDAGNVEISVEAPTNGDFTPALDRIFVDGLEAVKPLLPKYWQPLAQRNFAPLVISKDHPGPQMQIPGVDIRKIGGAVTAPKVLKSQPASYSAMARAMRADGKVMVELVLGGNGKILEQHLESAAGLGLDERALAALDAYVWQPAAENGVPVTVQLLMEMDFWTQD